MKRAAVVVAFLCAASCALAQGWGWTPGTPAIPPAPAIVSVRVGTGLQSVMDALPAAGGVVQLGVGRYYADLSDTTLQLTISKSVTLVGAGGQNQLTIVASPILVEIGNCRIEDLAVMPSAGAFGIKLYRAAGGGVSRCSLRDLWVGAVDAGHRGTGGPAGSGLYLDGAILTRIEHCAFAFNGKAGVYARSTSGTWSTNANTFHDCTFNLNGSYGVEFLGGAMEGNQIHGGNAEDNDSAEVFVQENTAVVIRGVDFESSSAVVTEMVNVQNSNPVSVEDCNFATSSATRAITADGCQGMEVRRCRFSGFPTKAPLAILGTSSKNCVYSANVLADTLNFVLNKGQMPISGQPWGEPWRAPMATFAGDLWLPDSTSGSGSGLGSPWVSNGTIARVTPTYGDSGSWMRRTSFSSSGAGQELGIKMTDAAEFQFFRNASHNAGGYYFSATFRIETWAGNAARLFVGLASAAAGSVVSAADSSGVGNNLIGLYHDANDANKFWIINKAAGAVTKSAWQIPSATNESFPASGKAFRFEMQYFPYTSITYCLLTRLEDGKVVGFQNVFGGPADGVMLAPQVELNNGTSGACSLGIVNVYVTR